MRKGSVRRLFAAAVTVGAVIALGATASNAGTEDHIDARATIRDAAGNFIGSLAFDQLSNGKVGISVRPARLTPGYHGFHVHAVGICDPRTTDPAGNPAPFLTAGPHFDPAGGSHGNHAGDMPPLLVARDGTASVSTVTDRFTVAALFDADRSAVIIHALPDNLAHIPTRYTSSTTGAPGPDAATLATGDAGGRFACGVVTR